ncbi:hypothetical protein [Kineosporia babensis]|uniref:WXG100 family type VII secretion target n=1 Tax=Kineosporia babensis TaxID=499548 RepID=A0A9X1ND69_9ACTN|nr:hypothetical protein [Kineosporia babensis]MCD5311599.1 hypothetical protein [Kineosporia babensis]
MSALLSWAEVSRWDTNPVESGYTDATRISGALDRTEASLPQTEVKTWSGDAADAAATAARQQRKTIEEYGEAAETLKNGLRDAVADVREVVDEVRRIKEYAAGPAVSLTIADDGTVSDELEPALCASEEEAAEYTAGRQDLVDQLARRIAKVVEKAKDADNYLVKAIDKTMTFDEQFKAPAKEVKELYSGVTGTVDYAKWKAARSAAHAPSDYGSYLRELSRYARMRPAGPDLGVGQLTDAQNLLPLNSSVKRINQAVAGLDSAASLADVERMYDTNKAYLLWDQLRGVQGEKQAMKTVQTLYPTVVADDVTRMMSKFDKNFLVRGATKVGAFTGAVMGPVEVGLGAKDVYDAVRDDDAATDQRIAKGVGGVASAVSGGTTTVLALGLIAPAAAPVALGVVVGGSVIAAGAAAYEHREQIGHALSSGLDTVGDVAGAAGDKLGAAGDRVGGLVSGGVSKLGSIF